MPATVVLVRHGETEGNVARELSKKGDKSLWSDEFRQRPGRLWRLTDLGIQQATAAGAWICKNVGKHFDRYITSEYPRAKETAGHLNLPDAKWEEEFYLRERHWGPLENLPEDERWDTYKDELEKRKADSFYWRPPHGESQAEVCERVDWVLYNLHQENAGGTVIVVCHEDVIWAVRARFEGFSQERWHEMRSSGDPRDRIHNGQVLIYDRRDPATGRLGPDYEWTRSVCPYDTGLSRNNWERIVRPTYTNEDLIRRVEAVPRLISGMG
jgi:NAD+ kinase